MECPTITRQQQQHMLDVLADLFGREYGVKVKLTLKDEADAEESEQATQVDSKGCRTSPAPVGIAG